MWLAATVSGMNAAALGVRELPGVAQHPSHVDLSQARAYRSLALPITDYRLLVRAVPGEPPAVTLARHRNRFGPDLEVQPAWRIDRRFSWH